LEAAKRFKAELDRAIGRIAAHPDQWPQYRRGTRFFRLRRFPYLIVYRKREDVIEVVAVAHARRKPSYWKKRIG
jgi:plasmid stabilization system protein ParE